MQATLPSIDQNICATWTEVDVDFYNRLPFFFAKAQAQYRRQWQSYSKVFPKIPWKPGMGDTMRTVIVEDSPILRQTAYPNTLRSTPLADVSNVRERKSDTVLHWQDFVTPHMSWLPVFQDFLGHVEDNMRNLNRQIEVFEDVFYRTQIYDQAPYVYVAGGGLQVAPTGQNNAAYTAAGAKNLNWLQGSIWPALQKATPGYLDFKTLFQVLNEFEQTVGGTPHEGDPEPDGESNPLGGKYCLMCSSEAFNQFVDDPWLKENRTLNLNIITKGYQGEIFGRITTRLERRPLRISFDPTGNPALYAPEVINMNPNDSLFGRTFPNPQYSNPSVSDTEVAFLIGGPAYKIIDVGPPPSEFTGDTVPKDFAKMTWNAQPTMTKNFLVPCMSASGQLSFDANSFGRYLRMQATANLGIVMQNSFNILPIFFKRRVGLTTST